MANYIRAVGHGTLAASSERVFFFILDASRIPTSPSRNESQGSGGYEGSGGACRRTKGGVSRHIPQEGEDVGGAVVVGVGGGRGGAGGGAGGGGGGGGGGR